MSVCLRGYPNYVFSYNEEEGKLVVMNVKRGREKKQRLNNYGYLTVELWNDGKRTIFLTSRLILMLFGPQQPSPEQWTVDHIDRNPLNNHLSNLRWASSSEQCLNQKFRGKGYSWHKTKNSWQVQFKGKHIGYYQTEEEAIAKIQEIRTEPSQISP